MVSHPLHLNHTGEQNHLTAYVLWLCLCARSLPSRIHAALASLQFFNTFAHAFTWIILIGQEGVVLFLSLGFQITSTGQ